MDAAAPSAATAAHPVLLSLALLALLVPQRAAALPPVLPACVPAVVAVGPQRLVHGRHKALHLPLPQPLLLKRHFPDQLISDSSLGLTNNANQPLKCGSAPERPGCTSYPPPPPPCVPALPVCSPRPQRALRRLCIRLLKRQTPHQQPLLFFVGQVRAPQAKLHIRHLSAPTSRGVCRYPHLWLLRSHKRPHGHLSLRRSRDELQRYGRRGQPD